MGKMKLWVKNRPYENYSPLLGRQRIAGQKYARLIQIFKKSPLIQYIKYEKIQNFMN